MNRWLILVLGMIANLAQGVVYAASVLRDPIMGDLLGMTDPAAVKSSWAVIFTMCCFFLPLGMLAAGWLEKFSHRLPILVGALLYGMGVFVSGFVTNFYVLCITFGFCLSFGSGFVYGPIVANSVRWFPDKKGLASGLVVGALGLGPVWIALLCATLLAHGMGITQVLSILGTICFMAISAALLIPAAPPHQQPPPQGKAATRNDGKTDDLVWTQTIRTSKFWLLFLLFFLGTLPGMMVVSSASSIFQEIGKFTPLHAANLVAVLAVANALGRFLWGTISDYIGRINALTLMYILSASAMITLILPAASHSAVLFTVIIVIGTTYGGYLGLFPSFCAESFGLKNMVTNYAMLFAAFSAASLVGPRIYASCDDSTAAFCIAAGLTFIGCVVTLLYRSRQSSKRDG